MKMFAFLSVPLAIAGAASSLALAKPPAVKPAQAAKKVAVCHKVGSTFALLAVTTKAALVSHLRHGDVVPGTDGKCPGGQLPPPTTTSEVLATPIVVDDSNLR